MDEHTTRQLTEYLSQARYADDARSALLSYPAPSNGLAADDYADAYLDWCATAWRYRIKFAVTRTALIAARVAARKGGAR